MASQGDPTQPRTSAQPPPPPPAPPAQEAGIDLTTLFLSAVASAAAAYVTSKIWAPGTLFSAAMSPVIVALVKEALRKPTEVVTAAVPAVARPLRGSSSTMRGSATVRSAPTAPPPARQPLPDDLSDRLGAGAPAPYPPPQAGAEAGPVRVYSTRGRRLRWRLAIVTGLLGFAVCVVVYTVPEVIAGKSVGRSGHATTFFPGKAKRESKPATSTTTGTGTTTTAPNTTTQPAQTVTQTVTTPAAPPETPSTAAPAAPAPDQSTSTTPPTPDVPPAQTTP
jgi:hypothetical protein